MHADQYLREVASIAEQIDRDAVERLAVALQGVRERKGRVFVIGLGGSLANAEHAAADLRKLCEIEAQSPNIPELTAWMNDAGQKNAFIGHLFWMRENDVVLILSVGGGTENVSQAIAFVAFGCKSRKVPVYAIVGPEGGTAAAYADIAIKVPAAGARVTPHTEAFQAVIWHCLVSHPLLQRNPTKW